MTSDMIQAPQVIGSDSDMIFFNACLFHIEEISSSLNKPLVDPQTYPAYPFDFDTASDEEKANYLDNCVKHWIEKDLISPAMIGIRDDDTLPAYTHDPFYQRILRTIAYSLQHPKATDPNGARNPYFSLGRFIDSYIHSRGNNIAKSQFRAFCIVETEEKTIPDHYGHSSASSRVRRKPTELEKRMDRLYRRALVFPTLNEDNPDDESLEVHNVEQCAENIALPYILKSAMKFLANGNGTRVITIYSLSMSAKKETMEFCMNCKRHTRSLTEKTLGLRIVDRGEVTQLVYQSDATYALWLSGQQEDSSSNSAT